MNVTIIILRTVLIYFVVFIILRMMGKREIGKLSVFDLVISIMVAEIAVFVIEDANKPLAEGIVPMVTLVCIQIAIAYLSLKSQRLRNLFEGPPSILINKGKLNREEMKRQRYNLDDLMHQLRQNQIINVADVEFAILETSGKLTVIKKDEEADKSSIIPETSQFRYEGLPLPLIMDGKVQDDNLDKIGKTRFWLKNQIQSHGAADFKEIFFCTIDYRGRFFIDKKGKIF